MPMRTKRDRKPIEVIDLNTLTCDFSGVALSWVNYANRISYATYMGIRPKTTTLRRGPRSLARQLVIGHDEKPRGCGKGGSV